MPQGYYICEGCGESIPDNSLHVCPKQQGPQFYSITAPTFVQMETIIEKLNQIIELLKGIQT